MNEEQGRHHQPLSGVSQEWSELLRRLAACKHENPLDPKLSSERVQEIFATRARELRCRERQENVEDFFEVLKFRLGEDRFAFPLETVSEVYQLLPITEIPNTPTFVLGVVNLRRRICSVVDLRRLLGLSVSHKGPANGRLLILASEKMEFAVPVDELGQVGRVCNDSLQSEFSVLSGRAARYFRGVTPERLVVLDAVAMLSDEELIVK
jgi:purine-binding chemotaxis protein CheW